MNERASLRHRLIAANEVSCPGGVNTTSLQRTSDGRLRLRITLTRSASNDSEVGRLLGLVAKVGNDDLTV